MPFAARRVQPEPAGSNVSSGVMVVPGCQIQARAAGQGWHIGSAVPTVWPAALTARAVLNWMPSTVPMSTMDPLRQNTAWVPVPPGTAAVPTTSALSLMA